MRRLNVGTDRSATLDAAEPSAAPRYVVSERHITRVARHMKQRHGSPRSSLIHACKRLTFSRDESHLRRAHALVDHLMQRVYDGLI